MQCGLVYLTECAYISMLSWCFFIVWRRIKPHAFSVLPNMLSAGDLRACTVDNMKMRPNKYGRETQASFTFWMCAYGGSSSDMLRIIVTLILSPISIHWPWGVRARVHMWRPVTFRCTLLSNSIEIVYIILFWGIVELKAHVRFWGNIYV